MKLENCEHPGCGTFCSADDQPTGYSRGGILPGPTTWVTIDPNELVIWPAGRGRFKIGPASGAWFREFDASDVLNRLNNDAGDAT